MAHDYTFSASGLPSGAAQRSCIIRRHSQIPKFVTKSPTCARRQHATHAVRTLMSFMSFISCNHHQHTLTTSHRQDHMVGLRQARLRRHEPRSCRRMVHMYTARNSRRQSVSSHGHTRGCVTRRGMWFPWNIEREVSLFHDPGHEWWATRKSPEAKAGSKDMTSGEGGGGD